MNLTLAIALVIAVVIILVGLAAAAAFLSGDFRGFLARLLENDETTASKNAESAADQPRFRKRPALLTDGELAFFPVLESILPDLAQHLGLPPIRAFAKIRLADLIEPDCKGGKGSPYMSWFGRIKSKHTDAVLVDAQTFAPICVIELDDKSHNSARAKKADQVKDNALASAGIPLARIPAQASYDRRQIGKSIAAAIKKK